MGLSGREVPVEQRQRVVRGRTETPGRDRRGYEGELVGFRTGAVLGLSGGQIRVKAAYENAGGARAEEVEAEATEGAGPGEGPPPQCLLGRSTSPSSQGDRTGIGCSANTGARMSKDSTGPGGSL